MRGRTTVFGCVLLAAACQTRPRDAFEQGQRAMATGDVLRAIGAFDAVTESDPRHAEARLFTAALEQRLRRQLEAMLLGLELRATRHDDAALAAFTSAERTWPGLAAAGALADATRTRLRTARAPAAGPQSTPRSTAIAAPRDDADDASGEAGASPRTGSAAAAPRPAPQPPAQLPPAPQPFAPDPAAPLLAAAPDGGAPGTAVVPFGPPAPATDARARHDVDVAGGVAGDVARDADGAAAAGDAAACPTPPAATQHDALASPETGAMAQLARLEAALANGEQVVDEVLALHRAHPDDVRVRARLARLLQQRGLVAYGRGQVRDALDDWREAVALDPTLRSAQALLEMAAAELATPLR